MQVFSASLNVSAFHAAAARRTYHNPLKTQEKPMTRAVTERGKALARKHEALRLAAYKPTPDDVWTIGYGHTRGVRPGLTCTKRQAGLWLDDDFRVAARALELKIGADVVASLTSNQHDALCDFVFNLGTGDPKKPEWQIWKLLRKRAYDQIPGQLVRFVYQGKKKLGGLVTRRNDDIALWSEGEPGSVEEAPSSSVTRAAPTPPAQAPKPFSTAQIGTVGIACAGGIAEGVKQVSAAIQPFSTQSEIVSTALSYAATVGAGAAVAVAVFTYLKVRQAKH